MKVAQMKATHLQTNYLESFNLSTMKKFISAALVVAMTAASCANKEDLGANNENLGNDNNNNTTELPSEDENQPVTSFTADFGDPMSKALPSYSDQTKTVTVLWEADDKVGVYAGENGPAEFTAQAAGATTTLKGLIGAADTYYAMYPYDANASIAAGQISTALPAEQTATADEFAAHLAVASTDGSSLSFKNVCALVRVYVGCEHVTKIEFKGNNNEVVAGDIVVDAATAEFSHGTTQEKVITVTPPADAATFPVGAYYFSVLPQNFTEGFTVTYYTTNGNIDTRSTEAVNVQRSNLVVGRALTAIAGNGSEDSPFIVANVHDLCCLSEVLSTENANYVVLENDIDMSGVTTWTPINNQRKGAIREIIFDGKGKTISNFRPTTITGDPTESGKSQASLFGIFKGKCENLNVTNAKLDGPWETVGIVAGFGGYTSASASAEFKNVHVSGEISVVSVAGGFVGATETAKYENCSANVKVTTSRNGVGGFVGRPNAGNNEFKCCYATGDVENTRFDDNGSHGRFAGGFMGGGDSNYISYTLKIDQCYATGNVRCTYQSGGLVGYVATKATITNCYATGDVLPYHLATTSKKHYGGIVGVNNVSKKQPEVNISNCYFTGAIGDSQSDIVGGILGLNATGKATITNSFVYGNTVAGNSMVGGLVGQHKGTTMSLSDCLAAGATISATTYGAIVGEATNTATLSNCSWNMAGANAYGSGSPVVQNGGFVETAYASASAVATALGWNTEIWDLSGDTPTLKCFE